MNVILLGYMGSGKSTVGKMLSAKMGYSFIDSDAYIEEKEQMSISELFKTKGEIYFRKQEHLYLQELLNKENIILALGGGTPCYGRNMEMILNSSHSASIYLKCTIPSLVLRLNLEKASRPLISHLKTDEELTEFIGKHLFERSHFYNQSKYTVVVDGKSAETITEEISNLLL